MKINTTPLFIFGTLLCFVSLCNEGIMAAIYAVFGIALLAFAFAFNQKDK